MCSPSKGSQPDLWALIGQCEPVERRILGVSRAHSFFEACSAIELRCGRCASPSIAYLPSAESTRQRRNSRSDRRVISHARNLSQSNGRLAMDKCVKKWSIRNEIRLPHPERKKRKLTVTARKNPERSLPEVTARKNEASHRTQGQPHEAQQALEAPSSRGFPNSFRGERRGHACAGL